MILGVLQARMSSARLPGKVLEPILGAPLILRAIERIRRATCLDGLVLATSVDPSDDPLVQVAEAAGVDVRRGPLHDVLRRFVVVADELLPDHVVRLTGDNALIDPTVIDRVVERHLESGADYTSNTLERTYPRGLDVEAVAVRALRQVDRMATEPDEREHVTLGIYRRPGLFTLNSVRQEQDRSDWRWTVDLPGDLDFVRVVYRSLHGAKPEFGQEDIATLLKRRPDLARTEAEAEQEAASRSA